MFVNLGMEVTESAQATLLPPDIYPSENTIYATQNSRLGVSSRGPKSDKD